jgi:hypothetical protein
MIRYRLKSLLHNDLSFYKHSFTKTLSVVMILFLPQNIQVYLRELADYQPWFMSPLLLEWMDDYHRRSLTDC